VYVDAPTADDLAARVYELRKRAGRLSGQALGEAPESEASSYDLLTDVAAALPPGKPKAWSEDVVARLSELRPEVYGRWSPEQLAAALKPYGVRTVQIWGTTEDGKGANRRGVRRTDITAAIARRDDGVAAA
jgi:S-DNA-T family DNA segregation ATPase FtsK/SpoIIIE